MGTFLREEQISAEAETIAETMHLVLSSSPYWLLGPAYESSIVVHRSSYLLLSMLLSPPFPVTLSLTLTGSVTSSGHSLKQNLDLTIP